MKYGYFIIAILYLILVNKYVGKDDQLPMIYGAAALTYLGMAWGVEVAGFKLD